MNKTITINAVLCCLVASVGVASAQGQPNDEVPLNPFAPVRTSPDAPPTSNDGQPQPADTSQSTNASQSTNTSQSTDAQSTDAQSTGAQANVPFMTDPETEENLSANSSYSKRQPAVLVKYPVIISAPTAHLLPAAVIYSSTSVDTGGGFGSSLRVGLGDVGEFGIETTDRIRFVESFGETPKSVQPLVLASFKMGVAEDRLFNNQPAMALGFRKSFQKRHEGFDLQVAAIELVASKTFGPVSVHAGGVFWDASLDSGQEGGDPVFLHGNGAGRQIRPMGGIEAEPLKNAQLMLDVYWVPRFDPTEVNPKSQITLRPTLSWGVRYKVSKKISIESGVRVPDIGEANLLDAQIFGQLSFTSSKLRDALGVGK